MNIPRYTSSVLAGRYWANVACILSRFMVSKVNIQSDLFFERPQSRCSVLIKRLPDPCVFHCHFRWGWAWLDLGISSLTVRKDQCAVYARIWCGSKIGSSRCVPYVTVGLSACPLTWTATPSKTTRFYARTHGLHHTISLETARHLTQVEEKPS